MLEKGKISAGEFLILVIAYTIGTSVLNVPAFLAKFAKQDAWLASALTTLIGLLFVFIYNQLATLYPSMTFVEVNEKVLGKWIGKITALLYLFYVYHIASASLLQIGDFFTTQIMVETPFEIIVIMFLFTSLIGVRLGLEVISRTALIFFPWIVTLLLILLFFLIPEIKLENMQPIFEEGIKPIIMTSFRSLGLPYLQLALFLMITPYVAEKVEMKKAFYIGTFIGGIVITSLTILCILVLGVDITIRQTFPSYVLGKKISIGDFFERIEVIVAIIWIFTIYFKVTISYYILNIGLAQVFGLKDYKILLFPLAVLIITFSIFMHPDILHISNYISDTLTPYSLTICFFLPLLLLVIGKMRKKRKDFKAINKI